MTGPRNFCVARGSVAVAGFANAYTVPAGHSFILKSFIVEFTGTVSPTLVQQYLIAGRGGTQLVTFGQSMTPGQVYIWQGWNVLNDADQLVLYTANPTVVYWIAGALLPYSPGQVAPAETNTPFDNLTTAPREVIYLPNGSV